MEYPLIVPTTSPSEVCTSLAYSAIASERAKVKGEEVEESKGVQGYYLTLVDHKSSMQMDLIFL
jgi:hypothetical protein